MKRTASIASIVIVLSLAVPLAPSGAHDAKLKCGHKSGAGAGWFKLRAHYGIGCTKARKLAQRWEDKCVWNDNCPGSPDKINGIEPGFKCRHEQYGYETVRVRCTANEGPGVVHFLWGS